MNKSDNGFYIEEIEPAWEREFDDRADDIEPWWERFYDEGDCFADYDGCRDEVTR